MKPLSKNRLPYRRAMGRRYEGLCLVNGLLRVGDACCFRAATAWRRNIFYGKTLHSLKWQPETNECVSATDSVKMRVRILTSCKNRVKTSYKQEEKKSQRDKKTKGRREEETKRQRDEERKRQRDKETKRQRDKERKRGRD